MKMRDEREGRARFLLGRLLSDLHKDECAAELLRESVRFLPDSVPARVELGIVYCRLGRYEEMIGAFREAIGTNTAAVRAAVLDEPRELEGLRRLLYPWQEVVAPPETGKSTIPTGVKGSWALVGLAREQIGVGHDEKAVAALEAALKLDKTNPSAVAFLTLAYLLSVEGGGSWPADEGSVLWEVEPELAGLLFKGWENISSVSH